MLRWQPFDPFDPFDRLPGTMPGTGRAGDLPGTMPGTGRAGKLRASSPGTGRTGGQLAAGGRYVSQQMAELNRYVKEIV